QQDRLNYTSYSYNPLSALDSTGRGRTDGDYTWSNMGANLNYQHTFRAGREITADLDYIRYHSGGQQDLRNVTTLDDGLPGNSRQFFYGLPSNITIYTAKADYQHALKKRAKLEAGFKSSVVTNDNQSDYYSVNETQYTPDYRRSNHFLYRETIHAAYLNARKDWKRVAVQAGLRVENTQAQGQQLGNAIVTGSAFEKNYAGVFPMVQLRFKLDSTGENGLNLSLARRINRANYYQLNPFLFYRDNYSYTSGNPDLNPQYNYIAEIKYQYDQLLNVGLRYGYFTDLIFSTVQVIDNVFITLPENIGQGKNIALTTNVSFSPAKWWHLNTNLTYAHLALKGRIFTENLNSSVNVARINVLNQFKSSNNWSGELGGFYESRNLAGQTIIDPRYRINAAVQKEIFKRKGTLRLVIEDVFYSWRQQDRTLSLRQAESFHTNQMDTRRIGLAFSYRFGKESFARKRKYNDNAADEEKGRVGQ
ncbi:MAG: outer membrane beta-barrel protein, partial [Bacteroidetes bacterium]|nr:outer membrane beta-barrel protein [Fibrella sp.]